MRFVLVFLDGVGVGDDDAERNVFVAQPPAVLNRFLGGAALVRSRLPVHGPDATLAGLDATLGVAGTPQSGTGQTALFTGQNGAALYGRHFGPWVPGALRPLVREESVLARAKRAGRSVAFANAYPEEVVSGAALPDDRDDEAEESAENAREERARARRAKRILNAGPPLVALGAGVLNRHTDALVSGDAVASEITNGGWREGLGRREVPEITAAQAGANLARIANAHDVTLYAHYATDYAGHAKSLERAAAAIRRVDEFVGGLLEDLADDVMLIVSSDHGNIEDASDGHTMNPAIGLVVGRGHREFAAAWTSLLDVTPSILGGLGIPR
jgi:2,3-bisphosphoglycerate-independent phosphoglycerate mutase